MTTFTFITPDGVSHDIVAPTRGEAMGIANRTLDLGDRFYAWGEARRGNIVRAMTGAWD